MNSANSSWTRTQISAALFMLIGLAGCGWKKPPAPVAQERFVAATTATLRIAPKDLVKIIQARLPQAPLSLVVETTNDGVIQTDWKEYEGAIHIARRWRERTRFRINVLPDFNDPLGTSHVDVFDETEEKPSDPQPWYPNPDLHRKERSDEILKAIQTWASQAPPATPTASKSN